MQFLLFNPLKATECSKVLFACQCLLTLQVLRQISFVSQIKKCIPIYNIRFKAMTHWHTLNNKKVKAWVFYQFTILRLNKRNSTKLILIKLWFSAPMPGWLNLKLWSKGLWKTAGRPMRTHRDQCPSWHWTRNTLTTAPLSHVTEQVWSVRAVQKTTIRFPNYFWSSSAKIQSRFCLEYHLSTHNSTLKSSVQLTFGVL